MKALKRMMDRIRPNFEEGGKLHALKSVYDGMDTFLFTPSETSKSGVSIHDSIDSKRVMIIVVLALVPCMLFGMYNAGYQHWLACGATEFPFPDLMLYGFLAVLPRIVVAYLVGLGIEFIVAQLRREEIQEGFLVTGFLIPLICPIETPLWMIAVATAFSVIFVKEVFGGTGYNVFNVALVTRAFLFFAYPSQMSGDKVFVSTQPILGLGGTASDGFTGATPLGQIATADIASGATVMPVGLDGTAIDSWQSFIGLIPGSFGETSTLCILIGAAILLVTGMASWKIMVSAVDGGLAMGAIAHACATALYPMSF
ncbi:MAG: RnfABCDGE type electron transport complex subunit D, partial [Muribaculaceae bacterium]|nr:RnfABCDGE type electron transport complex subunit D [Muribaculaceae bacterium]